MYHKVIFLLNIFNRFLSILITERRHTGKLEQITIGEKCLVLVVEGRENFCWWRRNNFIWCFSSNLFYFPNFIQLLVSTYISTNNYDDLVKRRSGICEISSNKERKTKGRHFEFRAVIVESLICSGPAVL